MASVNESIKYTYTADVDGFTNSVDGAKKSSDGLDTSAKKSKTSVDGMGKASKNSSGMISGLATSMAKVPFGPMISGAVTAGLAIFKLGEQTTAMASAQDRVNAVYGDSAIAIQDYASTASSSLGVVEQDYMKVASSMAVTAENSGMAEAEAEQYGVAIAQLSSIVSSYLGLPMAETAERLIAAMRGEAEAAEALGLTLNETTVANFAMANGATTAWSEMSVQEQMAWRLFTAIDQLANMMGVEVGAVNSVATAQQALTALTGEAEASTSNYQQATANLKNSLNDLILKITPLIEAIFGAITKFQEWWDSSVLVQTVLDNIAKTIDRVINAINRIVTAVKDVINRFKSWAEESELLQLVLEGIQRAVEGISNAVETLIGWINSAIDAFQEFRNQDFGSELINLGGSAGASSVKAGVNSQGFNGGSNINNNQSTQNNTFNIKADKVMSVRDAYRSVHVYKGGRTI